MFGLRVRVRACKRKWKELQGAVQRHVTGLRAGCRRRSGVGGAAKRGRTGAGSDAAAGGQSGQMERAAAAIIEMETEMEMQTEKPVRAGLQRRGSEKKELRAVVYCLPTALCCANPRFAWSYPCSC